MSPCHPFRPVPGQCGPNRRGPLPAPPFDPRDYWATRKFVSSLFEALETKLDNLDELYKIDVVDPGPAAEAGQAADAKSTYEDLNSILTKLANKRDKDDRAVYSRTFTGHESWFHSDGREFVYVSDGLWKSPFSDVPEFYFFIRFNPELQYGENAGGGDQVLWHDYDGQISEHPDYVDLGRGLGSIHRTADGTVDEKTNQRLAAVATGDAQKPADGDLVKYDAANDRFVKAVAGTDYIPFIQDLNDNKTSVTIGTRDHLMQVGPYSLANGEDTTAPGAYSHAEGKSTTASGAYSHAEGDSTKASGYISHAEGSSTTASGDYSHAEGTRADASGDYSHAEGDSTTASGYGAHAEGYLTTASGGYSHAEGAWTTANGASSYAGGAKAVTRKDDQNAFAWNGDGDKTEPYSSHGPGTFSINPKGGLDGFYIGEQTLTQVINAVIAERLSTVDPDNASVYDLIKALKGE